jgi:uracil phosphoribosyltransferase
MVAEVHVLDHPLIQHKLTLMRRKETSTTNFRRLLNEIGSLMAYEVTRDMPMHEVVIETPLETMLATGNSAVAAVERLKETRPRSVRIVCLVACPEGIRTFQDAHPDVPIYTGAIDRQLDDHGYILPGLGDAGDRIFGTK